MKKLLVICVVTVAICFAYLLSMDFSKIKRG